MIRRVPLWLALPAVAGLVLFLVYPTAYLIALALTDSSLGNPLRAFTGAQNFHTAFDAPAFVPSLWRSTLFALVATTATTGIGLLLAVLLRARGTRFGAVGALLLLPLVTAPVLIGVAWKLLLAPVGGGLSDVLSAVGLAGANPLGSGAGAYAVLLSIHIWQWTPFAVLVLFAALGVVRPELQESARIDGAGPWRTFTSVTWPAIAPTAWAVLILELVIGYRVFDLIVVITSGGPGFATTLSPYLIDQTGVRGSYDMGTAAAQTLVFAAVVGVVATVFTAARSRSVEAERA